MPTLWTSEDAFAILPLYFFFLRGLAQGRHFRNLQGRSSFYLERAYQSDAGSQCLQSSPRDGDTLPPGHRGSLVHLQAISSSTPKFLPGTDGGWSLQPAGSSTQRTHSLCLSQILMVGKAWPQVSGWITEQPPAPTCTDRVTAFILTEPRPHKPCERPSP